MRFLAYVHPLWQVAVLLLALWTLSLGLRMRRLRRRRRADRALLGRHVRAGLTCLALLTVGYVAGPVTLSVVREKPVFESGHAFFSTVTMLLLVTGGALGYRLWRARGSVRDRELHVFCMGLGLFLALVTVMLGLDLLP